MFDTPEVLREEELTIDAFADPQVGDVFHEMCAVWMYVVAVEPGGRVATMHGIGPCTLPQDGTLHLFRSHEAFRQHYGYKNIRGYWMRLLKRGANVGGWFPGFPPAPVLPDCRICAARVASAAAF